MRATQGIEEFLKMFGQAVKIVTSGQGSSATMYVTMDGHNLAIEIKKDTEEFSGDFTVKDGNPFAGENGL